jgi:hypothetical protein|tara:strand:- start:278 stop:490 length:213 start_codon:yes stop_codon:yes gene_type:complete
MNKYQKKIKHLRTTFLDYAQEKSVPGAWPEFLTEDFDFIEHMELLVMDKTKITPKQLRRCNKLYRKYRNV